MRPVAAIVEHYNAVKSRDMLGFRFQVLFPYVPFAMAKPWLKEGATEEDWQTAMKPYTEESVLEDARGYLRFAFGKAMDHRGISALRSIEKMEEFLWLLEKDAELEEFMATDSTNYGAPMLVVAARALGEPLPRDERFLRMAAGKMCHDECEDGCG